MGIQIVHYELNAQKKWGVVEGENIIPLEGSYHSLSHFLEEGVNEAKKTIEDGIKANISIHDVNVLSPVTKPARIICQGANYASHRAEAGMEDNRPPFNMIFSKADSSLCGAYSDVIKPEHVKLLDYEIELGLVIGKNITEPAEVTDNNLNEFIAGLVIANDVSARDIQLPQGQWLKGKSYPTFCPTGPFLYLLEDDEIPQIHNLDLKLSVNDEVRQSANTEQLLYKPAETIAELSETMELSVGDLLVTGTTGGVALNLSSEVMNEIMNPFVPGDKKMEMLVESQLESDRYLKDGDVIKAEINSPDGNISLGKQVNKVVFR